MQTAWVVKSDPNRGMVTRAWLAAHSAINPGIAEKRREVGTEQNVVDAQPGVPLPSVPQ